MTTCGPGGSGTESCCKTLMVYGGTFYRTYDPINYDGGAALTDNGRPTGEADPAVVSSFRLDRYDVTVGRFRQFIAAVSPPDGGPGWLPPPGSGKHTHVNGGLGLANVGSDAGAAYETGWLASDDENIVANDSEVSCVFSYPGVSPLAPSSKENLPMGCVSWWEAYAFCIWDGGFLPSEAEWEYAAAGGDHQRAYPWGSTDPWTHPGYIAHDPTVGASVEVVGTAPCGAGRFGQLDLVGNVVQWNLDWFAPDYVTPCVDCAYLTPAQYPDRVAAGEALPSSYRGWGNEAARVPSFGFRCARAP